MIRPVQISDKYEFFRMRFSLWPDSTAAESEAVLRGAVVAIHTEPAVTKPIILVAEREGGLCGFAEIGSRPFAEGCRSSPVCYLEGIWIDPDCRRSGVGLALVQRCKEWARANGFSEFASDCDIANTTSALFHDAAGFEETGRSICYRCDLDQSVG